MKRLALALLALAAACKKAPPKEPDLAPVVATVAGEPMIDFDERHGKFRCRAPSAWKAMEEHGTGGPLVMMFGTMTGPLRGKVVISVDYYDGVKGPVKTPQQYWEAMRFAGQKPSPLETRQVGGRTVYAVHSESPQHPPHGWKVLYMNREDAVLIPSGKGFFEVSHSAPADAYQQTLPVFQAVVESFQPKG